MANDWQEIQTSQGTVEAKVNTRGDLLMVREVGQTTEYPHTTVKIVNGEADFSTLHHSDPGNTGRFGMREVVIAAIAAVSAND